MRRVMILLCMTATLSGPLLRQAEAAGDFVRALSTFLDPAGTVFSPDGGVGDDSGETTLKAGGILDVVIVWSPCWDQHADIGGLPPYFILVPAQPDPGTSQRRQELARWLPLVSSRRHAWLQLLLI